MSRYYPIAYRFAIAMLTLSLATSCSHKTDSAALPKPTAFGAAIVESSGGNQFGQTGTCCRNRSWFKLTTSKEPPSPVLWSNSLSPPKLCSTRRHALTDSSGQVATNVSLGGMAGRYHLTVSTLNKSHKKVDLTIEEIALGYQQTLGRRLNDQYCDRCHNPESTVERVSNYDNLEIKPHPFTEGDMLNKINDADLAAIITHGGPALNKSPLMPAWGNTLSKSDVQALISYIRAISDPPSQVPAQHLQQISRDGSSLL